MGDGVPSRSCVWLVRRLKMNRNDRGCSQGPLSGHRLRLYNPLRS